MEQDESVNLFLQGRESWNVWAAQVLDERKTLENAGRWIARKGPAGLEAMNAETAIWLRKAKADFSRCHFFLRDTQDLQKPIDPKFRNVITDNEIDFSEFIFPGNTNFAKAIFHEG
jgi:hypothetical protein